MLGCIAQSLWMPVRLLSLPEDQFLHLSNELHLYEDFIQALHKHQHHHWIRSLLFSSSYLDPYNMFLILILFFSASGRNISLTQHWYLSSENIKVNRISWRIFILAYSVTFSFLKKITTTANSLDFKKGLCLLSYGKIWPKNTTSLGTRQKTKTDHH